MQKAERILFIIKKIVLKELRETFVGLTIIKRLSILDSKITGDLLKECDELIAILKRSCLTAQANLANTVRSKVNRNKM